MVRITINIPITEYMGANLKVKALENFEGEGKLVRTEEEGGTEWEFGVY